MPASEYKHTVFLWIEGYFPKRVAFYFLSKGLCTSVEQLYRGETNEPNIRVIVVKLDPTLGYASTDPENPLPVGKSLPTMRIENTKTGKISWIHETYSIITYFEDLFPGGDASGTSYRKMQATSALERATAEDILGALSLADAIGGTWLGNAAPKLAQYRGIPESEQSIIVARRAKKDQNEKFLLAQTWAADNLAATGWLTPAPDGGPGLADVVLAANVRYLELSWCQFLFEDEPLGGLREWYEKFKTLPFWHDMEETGRFPEAVMWGESSVNK